MYFTVLYYIIFKNATIFSYFSKKVAKMLDKGFCLWYIIDGCRNAPNKIKGEEKC